MNRHDPFTVHVIRLSKNIDGSYRTAVAPMISFCLRKTWHTYFNVLSPPAIVADLVCLDWRRAWDSNPESPYAYIALLGITLWGCLHKASHFRIRLRAITPFSHTM